jgi:hypothetical protein
MTNEQQRSPIFCLDKLKKHLYNTIWGIKPLLMGGDGEADLLLVRGQFLTSRTQQLILMWQILLT